MNRKPSALYHTPFAARCACCGGSSWCCCVAHGSRVWWASPTLMAGRRV